MRTDRRNRCDQIIDLIDRCLADRELIAPHGAPIDEPDRRDRVAV